jgi:hypothetical protein
MNLEKQKCQLGVVINASIRLTVRLEQTHGVSPAGCSRRSVSHEPASVIINLSQISRPGITQRQPEMAMIASRARMIASR